MTLATNTSDSEDFNDVNSYLLNEQSQADDGLVPQPANVKQTSLVDEDDDSYYTPVSKSSHHHHGWSSWSSWGKWKNESWSHVTYNFDSVEARMKREKQIKVALEDFKTRNKIIAKNYIGWESNLTRKSGIYSLSLNNTENWKADLSRLQQVMDTYKKLPTSPRVNMHTTLLSIIINCFHTGKLWDLFKNTQLHHDGNTTKIKELMDLIYNTLIQPQINDQDVQNIIDAIPPQIREEINGMPGHGGISALIPHYTKMKRVGKKLKIDPPINRYLKIPHISKWKRINKWFVQKTDYRALQYKEKILVQKKKLLVLVDASWSMSSESAYDIWVSFVANLFALKIFDIEVYYTTDSHLLNITPAMEKWVNWSSNGNFIRNESGSEWFDLLTARTASLSRKEDYVLVITDMRVPTNAEENLKAFIWAKKHLILSFWDKGNFACNVRLVKKYEDMANVITTLMN